MRVIIDQNGLSPESDVGWGYSDLKSLTFAPETGLLGQSASINQFEADIITADTIEIGDYMRLRDDLENLWAEYWLTSARRVDNKTVRVTGKSDLLLLDRPTLPAEFYNGVAVSTILDEIFDSIGYSFGNTYTVDPTIAAQTLTGFCPEQTARERLQWVCFAAGAYIKSYFCRGLQILTVASTLSGGIGELIPIDKTFYKPTITETDYVTAVTVKAFSFTQADPQSGDKYVTTRDGVTYVYTVEEITLSNPDIQPAQFPVNVVEAEEVMLLDRTCASAVATSLAQYYFKRTTVELDVINNAEYEPGQKVTVYGDKDRLYTGFITACNFRFGKQARSTLTVAAAEMTAGAQLTIIAQYLGERLTVRRYTFPVGYGYSVTNDYLDMTAGGIRRVYRPLTEKTEGTMTSEGVTVVVQYDIALELSEGVLSIISVDSVELDVDGENYVAVIG